MLEKEIKGKINYRNLRYKTREKKNEQQSGEKRKVGEKWRGLRGRRKGPGRRIHQPCLILTLHLLT